MEVENLDLSKKRIDKTLGYEYVYAPKHSLANKSGKVYVHRYLAAKAGVDIKDKHIHHKNKNKSDNTEDNLEVLCPTTHAKEHWKENLSDYIDSLRKDKIIGNCKLCNKRIESFPHRIKQFCSKSCFYEYRRKTVTVTIYNYKCVICSKVFTSNEKDRKACSRQCGNVYAASFKKKK